MTYRPPNHIGLVLQGKLGASRDVAFQCEALRQQLRDHVCPAWGWAPPGVAVYSPDAIIRKDEGCLLAFVDDDGEDDAAGFHSVLVGQPFGYVDLHQADELTASHEACEIVGNANLDLWQRDSDGALWAMELCDPVERDGYAVPVDLFGESRDVPVSNFLLPNYFRPLSPPPYDWLGRLSGPFTIAEGGYAIVQRDGVIDYVARGAAAVDKAQRRIREMSVRSRTGRLAAAFSGFGPVVA